MVFEYKNINKVDIALNETFILMKRDLSPPHIFTALWSVTCRIHVLPFVFEDLRRGERQVFVTYVTVINSSEAGRS